jgi:hypothetical protein
MDLNMYLQKKNQVTLSLFFLCPERQKVEYLLLSHFSEWSVFFRVTGIFGDGKSSDDFRAKRASNSRDTLEITRHLFGFPVGESNQE